MVDEGLDKDVNEERFLVEKSALLSMFRVCSVPGCGTVIDSEDVTVHTVGAAVIVKATCLQHHDLTWSSSSTVGDGHKKVFIINILLAAFTLFCGLNVSQVRL